MYEFDRVRRMTTPAVLADVAEAFGDRPFLVADDGELSYAAAAALAAKLAGGFTALGLEPGDRIGILLPNGIRFVATFFGAHAAGLSAVPLNTWYRKEELAGVARRAHLRLIVTQDSIFEFDAGVVADDIDVDGYAGALRWPAGAPLPVDFPSAIDAAEPLTALRESPAREAHEAMLLFTSGSSAEPKAVRLNHGGLLRNAHAIGERQGILPTDRFWFASPMFFVFGCANVLPNALTHAAALCLQERFEPAAALEFIERHACTVYYGVAPVTRALAGCPDLDRYDISTLRTGTANATPEDLRLAVEVLGVTDVCNAYGMTEGYGHTSMTSCADSAEVRLNSQGTVLPTQEIRIVGTDAEVGVDVPGHIQIRGLITPGYLDASDTARAFDDDGWFDTGDLGRIDVDGRLHYVGRRHEMMKVKGINISPLEVESLLVQHDGVDQAFVFGLPTPEGDQSVGCVLVPTDSAGESLGSDVREWMRGMAAGYKTPSTIRLVSAAQLPLTATGKISKRMLQKQTIDAMDPSTGVASG